MVKKVYPSKKYAIQDCFSHVITGLSSAPLKVQELLSKCNLPADFLVPFDPRIRAGRIMVRFVYVYVCVCVCVCDFHFMNSYGVNVIKLDRCKVMASKKKPLWLEFHPMSSPVSRAPVGIIFKEGDDLRQDMLVIQVREDFSFKGQIWHFLTIEIRGIFTNILKDLFDL